jgi:hypothetical protein
LRRIIESRGFGGAERAVGTKHDAIGCNAQAGRSPLARDVPDCARKSGRLICTAADKSHAGVQYEFIYDGGIEGKFDVCSCWGAYHQPLPILYVEDYVEGLAWNFDPHSVPM